MGKQARHTITIILHGADHVMTVEEGGKVTLIRSSKPERLWVRDAQGGTTSCLSLASCQETHLVMRESIRLEARL
ncbi:MAG: hypothetical protein ACLPY1_23885 [Terracidiphilus sp.]